MHDAPDHRYRARGVSSGKAEVHAAIRSQDKGLFPGAFCKIVPDLLSGDDQHCLIMHADTAGSKASLAYLGWREGLGDEVWQGVAQDALVMNIDDCACVGALGPYLVCNTIGRHARLIPGAAIAGIIAGYQRACDTLAAEGITCILTGGETADVGDVVRTVDVGCTVTTRLRRDAVIDASRSRPGDLIVGFSSTGQARWESRPNAGIGSNGLTSARHDALGHDYAARYPETYAPDTDPAMIYCGPHRLEDPLPGSDGMSIGQALLSPTRTYLPLIKALLAAVPRQAIHALIHCTGGGQTKIGHFGRHLRYIKDDLLPTPPLFARLREVSNTSWAEAYAVWNMGVRLEAVVSPEIAADCLAVAQDCGIEARIHGRVEAHDGPGNEVIILGEGGEHRYHNPGT